MHIDFVTRGFSITEFDNAFKTLLFPVPLFPIK